MARVIPRLINDTLQSVHDMDADAVEENSRILKGGLHEPAAGVQSGPGEKYRNFLLEIVIIGTLPMATLSWPVMNCVLPIPVVGYSCQVLMANLP